MAAALTTASNTVERPGIPVPASPSPLQPRVKVGACWEVSHCWGMPDADRHRGSFMSLCLVQGLLLKDWR